MKFSQIRNSVATKWAALGAAATMALPVLADANSWDGAVTEISGLKTGVIAIGGAIVAIAVASVGFFIIRRMINKA